MLKNNENSIRIMSPKDSSGFNTFEISDYKYVNNEEVLEQNNSIIYSTSLLSTINKPDLPQSSFVHKTPNEKCKKRAQYHESLERISKDETSINNRYKNVSKLKYETIYQKHYFFKSLLMDDEPRDTRLNLTKKELKSQLKQLTRNRKLNSLVNRRSGSVCDIVREVNQEIDFLKSDNSSLDLKQKKSSTASSSQLQNGHCNYPSCPKVILAPLQFCYQHYFLNQFSQQIPSILNHVAKDVRKRDNFETAENYLNKKSKSITLKNSNKRKLKSDISGVENPNHLKDNEKLSKNQLIDYTEESDINGILSHLPIHNYDFLTAENLTDNEYDSVHGKVNIIDLNPTVIKIEDKSQESDYLFEKFFEEADKTEPLYNGDFYSNNFHHLEKNFFYCDMNSSVATLLDM